VRRIADLVFIAAGTALLSVGAYYIHPAGPWLVSGSVLLALGVAILARNVRRT
jgi:hypothetical protein